MSVHPEDKSRLYNLQKCQIHRNAHILGQPFPNSRKCQCCGMKVQKANINICFGINDIQYSGQGLILYFEYIKMAILVAFLATCLYSIPGMYFNYISDGCLKNPPLNCSPTIFLKFCMVNRVTNFPQMKNQSYYLLGAVIIMFLIIQLYRTRFHFIEQHLQHISGPQKFAVFASVQSNDFNQQQIKKGLKAWWDRQLQQNQQRLMKALQGKVSSPKQLKIQKIIISQDIHQAKQIKDRLLQLKQQIIMIDNNQQFDKIKQQLKELKLKTQQVKIRQNNKCLIIFSYQAYAKYLLEYAKLFILIRPCSKQNSLTFNNLPVQLSKSPLPSEILWENHHFPSQKKLFRRILVYIATLAILGVAEGLLFVVIYLWFNFVKDGKNSTSNIQYYMSGLVSAFMVLINFFLYYFFIFMSKFQFRSIALEDQVSKAAKIIIAVFLNSGLLLLFAYFILDIKSVFQYNGFVDTISYSFIYAMITPHIAKYLSPGILYHWFRQLRIYLGSPRYSQKIANNYYERPSGGQSYHYYSWIIIWIWLGSFFAPLIPLSYPCVLVTFVIHYWSQKINYVYIYKQRKPWGSYMNYKMIQAIQFSQFLLPLGNIIVDVILRSYRNESLQVGPILISICLMVAVVTHMLFIPKNLITKLITCYYCRDKILKQPESYQEDQSKFLTTFQDQLKAYYRGDIGTQKQIKSQINQQIKQLQENCINSNQRVSTQMLEFTQDNLKLNGFQQ